MRRPRIYQNIALAEGLTINLDDRAHHHLNHVLRLQTTDQFYLFNGQSSDFFTELIITGKKSFGKILQTTSHFIDSSLSINLVQGFAKGEKMDFIIQKATELGVSEITPVFTTFGEVKLASDRIEKKLQHWQGIIIHACEQSGRNTLPIIHCPQTLTRFLESYSSKGYSFMLHPSQQLVPLPTLTDIPNKITLLIGCEGGFHEQEVEQAQRAGFQTITLGQRILRTETAGLAGLVMMQTLWGDFSCIVGR